MLPSRFINGSEKADDMILVGPIIEKVSNSSNNRDSYSAEQKIKNIHKLILSYVL